MHGDFENKGKEENRARGCRHVFREQRVSLVLCPSCVLKKVTIARKSSRYPIRVAYGCPLIEDTREPSTSGLC